VIYRVGYNVPIPGVNMELFKSALRSREEGSDLATLINMLSGGGGAGCALSSLGIMPYISASIIFSLLVKVIPSLEAVSKEGSAGQRRINQWTRWATVPLAVVQSVIVVTTLYHKPGLVRDFSSATLLTPGFFASVTAVLTLTAGTVFLMWIGEQITEYGIGNGISLLIMCGIIA